jgi:hypothetical protein
MGVIYPDGFEIPWILAILDIDKVNAGWTNGDQ